MGKRGLRQTQALGGLGQAAAFGQGQERFHMPKFKRRGSHEPVSSFI
jgi:hypothetical protein